MEAKKREASTITKQITREQNKLRMQTAAAAETDEELKRITVANTDGKYNILCNNLRVKLARQNAAVTNTEQYIEYLQGELRAAQVDANQLDLTTDTSKTRKR